MNIAVFIKSTTHHKGYGGFEVQNKILCQEFIKNGHEVTVFSPIRELDTKELKEDSINYVFVDAVFRLSTQSNWFSKSVNSFKKLHEKNKFDIVLSQSSAGLGIIRKKEELGVKVISICHGSIIGELQTLIQTYKETKGYLNLISSFNLLKNTIFVLSLFFGRQREFILHSDHAIAVSNAVKETLINETYIPEDRISVVHNGVPAVSVKIEKPKDNIVFVYISQLTASKGIKMLLPCFVSLTKNFPEKNLELLILGDGPERPFVEDYAAKAPNIKFLGKLPSEAVMVTLAQANIFVLPTIRKEGFPMSIVEAMLCELAILASDIGGIKDAVIDNETGLLLQAGNEVDLYDKMLQLVSKPEDLARLSKNARLKAEAEFTSDIMYKNYMKIINEVLSK